MPENTNLDNPSQATKQATKQLKEMFVDVVQERRIKKEQQKPVKRPVFLKPHGIAHGRFEILPNLAEELKVGLFKNQKTFKAWIRFSSDTTPDTKDYKTTCGVAIKLFDVYGPKALGNGETQDFLFQNYNVFFVDTAQDMAEFTKAGVVDANYDAYLKKHSTTKQILDNMQKSVNSCLAIDYWSVLPYAYGQNHRYVKYKLVADTSLPPSLPYDDDNYLAADLRHRLLDAEVKFKFMVQFQTNEDEMPLDKATVEWSEETSPPIHVANLVLPKQDICTPGQAEYGENLAFNPWHSLVDHTPQGSISEARKVVYKASADNRHTHNGIPLEEPTNVRATKPDDIEVDNVIVKAAIHPSIGVARVGNSKEYFIGPEVTAPIEQEPGFYRDAQGRLKRQAARFRIYGYNTRGEVVKELTDAKVEWSVHLANKKSSWYEFQLALDIPEASKAATSMLRNANIADRDQLTIDGKEQILNGFHKKQKFVGQFMGKEVYLGEAITESDNRLVVVGGHGNAASYNDVKAVTFANNEGWHDDISDGPVTATVIYEGQKLSVDPAWIVVAPPNYAPMQKSIRTMWDLIRDVCVSNQMLEMPLIPSFQKDIQPIFERMSDLQWVNAGFAGAFGWNGPFNFNTPEWLAQLADPSPSKLEMRTILLNQFRVYDRDKNSPIPYPWLYGDAMNVPPSASPRQHSVLTDLQMSMLQKWAKGEFVNDYQPDAKPPLKIEDVPLREQPAMLDQASLEYCLADAFHPGCEMTWPMRKSKLYMSAFRIKHAQKGTKEASYGAALTTDTIGLEYGPIAGGQLPGGITRWMAVPWHTDTASCRSSYGNKYDPYLPTFWPARVPNQVLTQEDYKIVMDESRPNEERMQAFARRANWLAPLGLDQSYTHQINEMIQHFDHMSVVENRPGPAKATGQSSSNFPQQLQVADDITQYSKRSVLSKLVSTNHHIQSISEQETDLTSIDKVKRLSRAQQ